MTQCPEGGCPAVRRMLAEFKAIANDLRADRIPRNAKPADHAEMDAKAVAFLKEVFRDGQPHRGDDILNDATRAGIRPPAVFAAKAQLAIKASKDQSGNFVWHPPATGNPPADNEGIPY